MALDSFTFAGVDSAPWYSEVQDENSLPREYYHSIDGETCYAFVANFEDNRELVWRGILPGSKYSTLLSALGAAASSLVTSKGTCSAVLVECTGIPAPGNIAAMDGSGNNMDCRLVWIRMTDYA